MNKRGLVLIELIIIICIIGLIMGIGLPALWKLHLIMSLKSEALFFFSKMKSIRYEAITKHKSVGIVFYKVDKGWYYIVVRDGNGNGILTKDISDGIDVITEGPNTCKQAGFAEVGVLNEYIPEIPPGEDYIDKEHPVQFGKSGIFACSSVGTCTSGTIYFMSSAVERMQAVRVYAPTSRISLWEYSYQNGWHKN